MEGRGPREEGKEQSAKEEGDTSTDCTAGTNDQKKRVEILVENLDTAAMVVPA